MKNVNTILQSKLYEILQPAIPYPVYYKFIPANVNEVAHVVIESINNTETSTQQTSDTDSVVQISIFTNDTQANDGSIANDIADLIYATIYPNRNTRLDLIDDGFQNCGISLVNDVTPDVILTDTGILINRFITFRFDIFHF